MSLLGNLIWLLSSFYIPLLYLLGALILFPLFPFLLPLVKYSVWPFGRVVVSNSYLQKFKSTHDDSVIEQMSGKETVSTLLNIAWLLTFGWILALAHLISLVLNGVMIFTIIFAPVAIPNLLTNARMIPIALWPLNRSIISSELHKKLKNDEAEKQFEKIKSS